MLKINRRLKLKEDELRIEQGNTNVNIVRSESIKEDDLQEFSKKASSSKYLIVITLILSLISYITILSNLRKILMVVIPNAMAGEYFNYRILFLVIETLILASLSILTIWILFNIWSKKKRCLKSLEIFFLISFINSVYIIHTSNMYGIALNEDTLYPLHYLVFYFLTSVVYTFYCAFSNRLEEIYNGDVSGKQLWRTNYMKTKKRNVLSGIVCSVITLFVFKYIGILNKITIPIVLYFWLFPALFSKKFTNDMNDIYNVKIPIDFSGHKNIDFQNGTNYCGDVKDGKMHGFGIFTCKNGDTYEGEWKNGLMNGKGTQTFMGDWYNGEFKDGKKDGFGHMIYADGAFYIGHWSKSQFNGPGSLNLTNGKVMSGEWKKGKLIKPH